ncbi:MAG: hypothetical protein AVDCRST_MAG56-779, partial [uncultured Cytophagales bacterium]
VRLLGFTATEVLAGRLHPAARRPVYGDQAVSAFSLRKDFLRGGGSPGAADRLPGVGDAAPRQARYVRAGAGAQIPAAAGQKLLQQPPPV